MGPKSTSHPFEARLCDDWPSENWRDLTILLAVSGGADSVALLRAMHRLSRGDHRGLGAVHVAHFNHGWRGMSSDGDEAMVVSLSAELHLNCFVGHSLSHPQTEDLARSERYDFLFRTARSCGARYLVTAHTLDDQAETILHRIVRGTALRGLAGIPARRRVDEAITLVRPLLWATREQVLDYLAQLGQTFREDTSNQDCRFTRNRIRNELIPYLTHGFNPEVVKALTQLGRQAGEAQAFIQSLVEPQIERCVEQVSARELVLKSQVLRETPTFLRREILLQLWQHQGWPQRAMTFAHWSRLSEQALSIGATSYPGNIHVRNDGMRMVLRGAAVRRRTELD